MVVLRSDLERKGDRAGRCNAVMRTVGRQGMHEDRSCSGQELDHRLFSLERGQDLQCEVVSSSSDVSHEWLPVLVVYVAPGRGTFDRVDDLLDAERHGQSRPIGLVHEDQGELRAVVRQNRHYHLAGDVSTGEQAHLSAERLGGDHQDQRDSPQNSCRNGQVRPRHLVSFGCSTIIMTGAQTF